MTTIPQLCLTPPPPDNPCIELNVNHNLHVWKCGLADGYISLIQPNPRLNCFTPQQNMRYLHFFNFYTIYFKVLNSNLSKRSITWGNI